jgi:cell division protein ZapA
VSDLKPIKPPKDAVAAKAVTISIMGREFRVAAPDGEERQLLASVDYLNKKMGELRDTGKVIGLERLAILTALNIAHEHLQKQGGTRSAKSLQAELNVDLARSKMSAFEEIIEKAISDQEKLF